MSILQSKLTDHQSLTVTLPTESQTFPRGQGQGSITSLTIFFYKYVLFDAQRGPLAGVPNRHPPYCIIFFFFRAVVYPEYRWSRPSTISARVISDGRWLSRPVISPGVRWSRPVTSPGDLARSAPDWPDHLTPVSEHIDGRLPGDLARWSRPVISDA